MRKQSKLNSSSKKINKQPNSSLGINNVIIEKVNSIKYVGFIIVRDLKLKKHLEYVEK